MDIKIERQINLFLEGLGGVKRKGFFHGTLYMVLHNDSECDFYHKELRKFYREFINPTGGVNMYLVGDEFVFDFVPEESEKPAYEQEPIGSQIDTMLELENEMSRGK